MTVLKEGMKAPEFTGVDQKGKAISLTDYKGKKVVLYFYPKDNTPGCTAESCNLRDHNPMLIKNGYQVIGVSADTVASHEKFATRFGLPFPLIADTEKIICNLYGVWGEKKFLGKTFNGIKRTTFVIDENGNIDKIITNVTTNAHTSQILTDKIIKK
jgi:peroxiredoxin Q/BCP